MSGEPTEGEKPKTTRAPRYKVFERAQAFTPRDLRECLKELAACPVAGAGAVSSDENIDRIVANAMRAVLHGWFQIGDDVAAATDRKAITSVIGTPDEPVEGFDADRRLLPHAAVLVGQWHERQLKREVHKPTPEEAAKLKALLDGTVTEEWES